jgi:nucleoside-diphosphate kinase
MGFINGCEGRANELMCQYDNVPMKCINIAFINKLSNWLINKLNILLRRKKQSQIMSNRTLTMIKPDAMKKGYAGAILDMVIKDGFRVVALKQLQLTTEKAGEFYAVHKARPFYGELVEFMSSGPIIAAILEKENAVVNFRKLIGATDPAKADEGTIRKKYASSVGENAVHGSDSDENARIEGDFFFSALERF